MRIRITVASDPVERASVASTLEACGEIRMETDILRGRLQKTIAERMDSEELFVNHPFVGSKTAFQFFSKMPEKMTHKEANLTTR